ncbi:MAG TPA: hypothetical protein VL866_10585 [Pyrinomonadaceae bacterium]|nr:hypothetical protein [Pyrinomonadaceae bacterium]
MKSLIATLLSIAITGAAVAQQKRTVIRVGDAFYGPVKTVRSELVRLTVNGDSVTEGSRALIQVIKYTPDGLTRETESYYPNGALRQKIIEKYYPSGKLESQSIYDAKGDLVSKTTSEYDQFGGSMSETRQNPDGSAQSQTVTQSVQSAQGIVAVSKTTDGRTVETSVNTRQEQPKKSQWTTTRPDGTRQENIFSVDSDGNHNDEQISYKSDGSVAGRRLSKVDRDVTRLEAIEYDGEGNVKKRTLETREYDSYRNIKKTVAFRWNAALEKFEPVVSTYNNIEYFE